MDDQIEELKLLADRFKANGKLSKNDQEKAENCLKKILGNKDNIEQGVTYLFRLPAQSSAVTFCKIWQSKEEDFQNSLIECLINNPELNSKAGLHRELFLIREFALIPGNIAVRLLADWCSRTTKQCEKAPATANIESFRKQLMDDNILIKIPLEDQKISVREISAVALVVICCLISDLTTASNSERTRFFFDWLKSSFNKPALNPKVSKLLYKQINEWPEELRRELVSSGILTGIVEEFIPRSTMNYPKTENKNFLSTLKWRTVEPVEPVNPPKEPTLMEFDPQEALKRIGSLITNLENELTKYKIWHKEAEKNMENEKHLKNQALNKLSIIEEDLNQYRSKTNDLNNTININNEKIKTLEAELTELKEKHTKKVESLVDLSEHGANFAVEEFKNVLSRALHLEYEDFTGVINEEITPELADNFRAQLENIFRILIGRGIKL